VTDRSTANTDATFDSFGGWPGTIGAVASGTDIVSDHAHAAMAAILADQATAAQIAGFIVALRVKGETVAEMIGLVRAMLDSSEPLTIPGNAIDIVGTGGSAHRRKHALNVSTMAAFVAAGAGAVVCKHGNYKASSTSGSFDFLQALGVRVDLTPAEVERQVADHGLGFALARTFHPSMRHAGPVRAELGIPTVFNSLGPLAHPGHVRRQVIGCSSEMLAERMSLVLAALGSQHAWVVSGDGGIDEISTTGPSVVFVVKDGDVRRMLIELDELGIPRPSSLDELAGGSAEENVAIFKRILDGTETGSRRDIVVLNAAAGLVVSGRADDLGTGVDQALAAIADGSVAAKLEALQRFGRG
jgi:anthranilate phosphoribosyltransferase